MAMHMTAKFEELVSMVEQFNLVYKGLPMIYIYWKLTLNFKRLKKALQKLKTIFFKVFISS